MLDDYQSDPNRSDSIVLIIIAVLNCYPYVIAHLGEYMITTGLPDQIIIISDDFTALVQYFSHIYVNYH